MNADEPVPLRRSLEHLARLVGSARPDTQATLESQWEALVGARWASGSRPIGMRRGVLLVGAADPALAEQLRWAAADLAAAANALLGGSEVQRVEVRVLRPDQGPQGDAGSSGTGPAPGRAPRS